LRKSRAKSSYALYLSFYLDLYEYAVYVCNVRSLAFSPSDLFRGEALISASESDGDSGALYILAMAARFTGFSVKPIAG
jgi:hypothetical protein